MSHLRNKYRALLGAFSQQDTDVWSGTLNQVTSLPNKVITWQGRVSTVDYSTLYIFEIPKNANQLTIVANSRLNPNAKALYKGMTNDNSFTLFSNLSYIRQFITSETFTFNANEFAYIGISLDNSVVAETTTFEFSKNSGGGY